MTVNEAGDLLTLRLVAERTETVGRLLLYPFFVTAIFVAARSGMFDAWSWPGAVTALVVLILLILLGSGLHLQRSARRARQGVLRRLEERRLRSIGAQPPGKESATEPQLAAMREEVRSLDRGAFASWSANRSSAPCYCRSVAPARRGSSTFCCSSAAKARWGRPGRRGWRRSLAVACRVGRYERAALPPRRCRDAAAARMAAVADAPTVAVFRFAAGACACARRPRRPRADRLRRAGHLGGRLHHQLGAGSAGVVGRELPGRQAATRRLVKPASPTPAPDNAGCATAAGSPCWSPSSSRRTRARVSAPRRAHRRASTSTRCAGPAGLVEGLAGDRRMGWRGAMIRATRCPSAPWRAARGWAAGHPARRRQVLGDDRPADATTLSVRSTTLPPSRRSCRNRGGGGGREPQPVVIDGDTSTSDTCLLLASGAAGNRPLPAATATPRPSAPRRRAHRRTGAPARPRRRSGDEVLPGRVRGARKRRAGARGGAGDRAARR